MLVEKEYENMQYVEQIYYFSLRKTSDRYNAEELTQGIMLEIIKSHKKGFVPQNTRAWVCSVARNCYCKWVKNRSKSKQLDDIDELCDILSDKVSVADSVIADEEQGLLYRELRLLSEKHRHIISEYYFRNRPLKDIADGLNLPYGTVKRILYECRNNLKEGMKMSRSYGKRKLFTRKLNFCPKLEP